MQGTIVKEQQYLISNCETAFEAWNNLHNAFDKQNTISSFYQIKAMHDLKHSDNTNIIEYIQTFGTMWSDLQNRLVNSSERVAANAKALYDMDEYETIVFLASLSSSMNDIVDNLQSCRLVMRLILFLRLLFLLLIRLFPMLPFLFLFPPRLLLFHLLITPSFLLQISLSQHVLSQHHSYVL